jgi:hypothetical protein
VALDKAGRAVRIPDADVDAEQKRLEAVGKYKSDDPHILALARVSRVRLLCSNDHLLCADFKNKKLIDKPRGKIYWDIRSKHILGDCER